MGVVVEVLCGAKTGGVEHLADTAVEALEQAVGLRAGGFDQAMHDGVRGAQAIERMAAGRLALPAVAAAIGEFFAVDLGPFPSTVFSAIACEARRRCSFALWCPFSFSQYR